jgi:formate hydrogenlyase subunit 3/multisubunit Na+/H+ antiporter MnhD subunit
MDSILLCLAGAVVAALLGRHRAAAGWVAALITVGTALLVFFAIGQVLALGPSSESAEFWVMPGLGLALRIHVDGLSAWFLMLAALVAVPAMFFSISYMGRYAEYSLARYYPHFLLFLAAIYGLICTTDMMWFFFIFWQMMTLSGYALIRFESRQRANVRAANKYLVMMQIACILTMIGAEILAASSTAAGGQARRHDFDTVRTGLPALLRNQPVVAATAFMLFLVGFGIKLGMWPFGQVWLPDAHPAAPSPVSAMLSGVMIKTGVYGIMRYFLWLVPLEAQADYPMRGWGAVLAGLGTVTLFTGTLQALKQEQAKRLLAFHSIGQVGYILLGIGVCLALMPMSSQPLVALATVGFLGALLHTLNHGLFKSLLFLNSGSVLWATDTQDLNRLGGLMRFMPLTALTAFVASLSISGVPLFNGFVSKWCVCVAAVQGGSATRYLGVCAAIAILTSSLTLASFVKFFGASFLSRTSKLVAARSQQKTSLEGSWLMQGPQLVLAALCVVLGIMPVVAFQMMHLALARSNQGLGSILAGRVPVTGNVSIDLGGADRSALFAPLLLAVVLALTFLAAFAIARVGRAPRRRVAPWLCGYDSEADHHRYAAHSFYGEIKRYFRWLGGAPHSRPDKERAR